VLWAWVEISSPSSSRQELEQRRQAVRLLDVATGSTDISPRDLDSLMVFCGVPSLLQFLRIQCRHMLMQMSEYLLRLAHVTMKWLSSIPARWTS